MEPGDNCSRQVGDLGRVCPGFPSHDQQKKLRMGLALQHRFGIRKTPFHEADHPRGNPPSLRARDKTGQHGGNSALSPKNSNCEVSRQGVAHLSTFKVRYVGNSPSTEKQFKPHVYETPTPTQVHQEKKTGGAHGGCVCP
ncbi:hypothetical protein TNIN_459771 [Trichonephila inaurata madagascariensis]|uniref:Uncharacterized protein n=1 Tax=Trichonephila inaurata madagascariensis TaxID=2747483 RepID=A0A8X7CNZ1_9ARAC|nr:hypothetical protein TNIN_459771 [Trichonephila inaurata madagascariensis]